MTEPAAVERVKVDYRGHFLHGRVVDVAGCRHDEVLGEMLALSVDGWGRIVLPAGNCQRLDG